MFLLTPGRTVTRSTRNHRHRHSTSRIPADPAGAGEQPRTANKRTGNKQMAPGESGNLGRCVEGDSKASVIVVILLVHGHEILDYCTHWF